MPTTPEPTRFTRLTVGQDGVSHFVDDELPMESRDFAPPAAPLDVSPVEQASSVIFWRAPPSWDGSQHPAPARQWAFVLQGAIEITASDGGTRRLHPGEGVLLEDVVGDGHTTRVVGEDTATGLFIRVPGA